MKDHFLHMLARDVLIIFGASRYEEIGHTDAMTDDGLLISSSAT